MTMGKLEKVMQNCLHSLNNLRIKDKVGKQSYKQAYKRNAHLFWLAEEEAILLILLAEAEAAVEVKEEDGILEGLSDEPGP